MPCLNCEQQARYIKILEFRLARLKGINADDHQEQELTKTSDSLPFSKQRQTKTAPQRGMPEW